MAHDYNNGLFMSLAYILEAEIKNSSCIYVYGHLQQGDELLSAQLLV